MDSPIDITDLVRERQDPLIQRRLDRIECRFAWAPGRPCPFCYSRAVEPDGPPGSGRYICRACIQTWERTDG